MTNLHIGDLVLVDWATTNEDPWNPWEVVEEEDSIVLRRGNSYIRNIPEYVYLFVRTVE